MVVWLLVISRFGKTTLGNELEIYLNLKKENVTLLMEIWFEIFMILTSEIQEMIELKILQTKLCLQRY